MREQNKLIRKPHIINNQKCFVSVVGLAPCKTAFLISESLRSELLVHFYFQRNFSC